jgi:hypothetical protein
MQDFFNPTEDHRQLRSMLRDFVQREVRRNQNILQHILLVHCDLVRLLISYILLLSFLYLYIIYIYILVLLGRTTGDGI